MARACTRALIGLAVTMLTLAPAGAFAVPLLDPASGHWYEVVDPVGGITWEDARAAAEAMTLMGMTGHLAVITSAAENRFVTAGLDAHGGHASLDFHWLGGVQAADSEPAAGWSWITGESFAYTHWGGGEPNDAGGTADETRLAFFVTTGADGRHWNDAREFDRAFGYVVEWEPARPTRVPVPPTAALLALGAVVAVGVVRMMPRLG